VVIAEDIDELFLQRNIIRAKRYCRQLNRFIQVFKIKSPQFVDKNAPKPSKRQLMPNNE